MTERSNLTLWGRSSSANVQKILWALKELNLPFEHREVGGKFGGLAAPDYLALNPNGLVPTLQDGAFTVWESHAILRYLAGRYGENTLWREDPAQRAIVDQWTDWTATTFQPAWISLFWLQVRTPASQHNLTAIQAATARTIGALEIMEGNLVGREFLAGEGISYADIAAGAAMYRLMTMPFERPAFPAVTQWYGRLAKRSAFQRAVMVSYDELVGRLEY